MQIDNLKVMRVGEVRTGLVVNDIKVINLKK